MTADQFKTARKSKGMTQRQLCAFLGVSFSAVTKWETGANPIPKWVEEKLLARQEVTLRGLSAAEIAKFQQKAAARGMSADEIAAELIRNFLKLSLLAFGLFQCGPSLFRELSPGAFWRCGKN